MRAMLCAENERFPNGCKLSARAPARVEGTSLVFSHLPPGRYAFSVIHDEDNSGRLGVSSVSGKPKGIGFSNNVTGPGGVPTFNLAAVNLQDAGFKVDSVPDGASTEPKGTVTRQSPQAGTTQNSGSTITILVSSYEPPPPVTPTPTPTLPLPTATPTG